MTSHPIDQLTGDVGGLGSNPSPYGYSLDPVYGQETGPGHSRDTYGSSSPPPSGTNWPRSPKSPIVQAEEHEKRAMRALLQASTLEREKLMAKLKDRHREVIQLFDALQAQKTQVRRLAAQNREQSSQIVLLQENVDVLKKENVHLKQAAEQEAQASNKHVALLRQQITDKNN
eukprot:1334704-Amorphochlora_amoeboformis.AAC.1